jgi:hypothetical protein
MPDYREAQLKRVAAHRHRRLPARMWTSASRLAELVLAEMREAGKRLKPKERPLADTDFAFRGGQQRDHTRRLRTRITDPMNPRFEPA